MGVSAKVIEHITDDAYNRQGDFRGGEAGFHPEKRGKKQSKTNRRAVGFGTFFCVYTCGYINKYTNGLSVNSFMLYLRCKSNI